jgi:hypothetical protein
MSGFERRRILEYISMPGNGPTAFTQQTYTDLKRLVVGRIITHQSSNTWDVQGQKLTTTYQPVKGSVVSYKPPPNTSYIIYRFEYAIGPATGGTSGSTTADIADSTTNCSTAHFKFQINDVDVGRAYYTSRANRLHHRRETFEWVIHNASPNDNVPDSGSVSNYGTQLSWGEEGLGNDNFKTLRMVARGRIGTVGSRDLGALHTSAYWNGSQQNIPILPHLTIIALGGFSRVL